MKIIYGNLKKPLGFIVRNRRGYQSDFGKYSDYLESFRVAGFINTGHTLKADTYSVTKLADNYYKEMYGVPSYYIQRLKGIISKLFK